MDAILAPIQDAVEGQIDFHGQKLAESLSTSLQIIFGAVAFIVGYVRQDIHLTLWIGLAGVVLTALVVVPPWPFFNQHPENWLYSKTKGAANVPRGVSGIIVDGAKIG